MLCLLQWCYLLSLDKEVREFAQKKLREWGVEM